MSETARNLFPLTRNNINCQFSISSNILLFAALDSEGQLGAKPKARGTNDYRIGTLPRARFRIDDEETDRMNGLVVPHGQGRKLITRAQEVTFKVTGAHGAFASCFEVLVPPGFDVGAHSHDHAKEFFYVLEGELEVCAFEPVERIKESWQDWVSPGGDRVVRADAGSCMFVPTGCPHAFRNPTDKPARMLFQSYPPPDHERYFEELCEIFAHGRTVDSHAVRRLRDRYDIDQITPLRYGLPVHSGA